MLGIMRTNTAHAIRKLSDIGKISPKTGELTLFDSVSTATAQTSSLLDVFIKTHKQATSKLWNKTP